MASENVVGIAVKIEGANAAARELDNVKKSAEGVGKSIETTTEKSSKSFGGMIDSITSKWVAFGAAVAGTIKLIDKAFEEAKGAAKFADSAKAMEEQFGISSKVVLDKLRSISKGTISDSKLLEVSNRAFALGVTKNVDELSKLLEVARVKSKALGIDSAQAFDDLVTGIGRKSPMLLDNLSIVTTGWDEIAKAEGKAMDAQFLVNKIIQDSSGILENAGSNAESASASFSRFSATIENAKRSLGEALIPAFNELMKLAMPVLEWLMKLNTESKAFVGTLAILTPAIIGMGVALGPVGAIFAGLGAVMAAYASEAAVSKSITEEFSKSITKLSALDQAAERVKQLKAQLKALDKATILGVEVPKTKAEIELARLLNEELKREEAIYNDLAKAQRNNTAAKSASIPKTLEQLKAEAEAKKLADERREAIQKLYAQYLLDRDGINEQIRLIDEEIVKYKDSAKAVEALTFKKTKLLEEDRRLREEAEKKKSDEERRDRERETRQIVEQIQQYGGLSGAIKSLGDSLQRVGGVASQVGSILTTIGTLAGDAVNIASAFAKDTVNGIISVVATLIKYVADFIQAEQRMNDFMKTTSDTFDQQMNQMEQREIDYNRFMLDQQQKTNDTWYQNEVKALKARLGLTELETAVKEDQYQEQRTALEEQIAAETDITKKGMLERQLQLLDAQYQYNSELARLDDEKKKREDDLQVKREELEKQSRKLQRDSARAQIIASFAVAEANARTIQGYNFQTRRWYWEEAVDRIVADRAKILSEFDSIPAFAKGGSFVTNGPQPIMVGDNPGGKELVTVTPMGAGQGQAASVAITGPVTIQSDSPEMFFKALQRYQRQNGVIG